MRRSPPLPQHQLGAQRDQSGRHVADRGAVGDIAADRARVADLEAADAADQLAEIRVEAGERFLRLGIAHGRADREAVRALLDPPQIGDVADEDGRAEILEALGHPKPDIGGPGDDPRLGMRDEQRQLGRGPRRVAGPARKRARSRAARATISLSSLGPGGLASPASRIGP